jgi:hypothetical protein
VVVDGLLGVPPASSQHAYIKFGKLAEAILPRKTIVAWVPGHKDVSGNEVANRLAKEGSELPAYNQNHSSPTNVGRWAKLRKKLEHESFWYPNPVSYKKRRLDVPANPPELQLPRTALYRPISERSGNGPFVEYHERFGHDASPHCKCGEPRTQGHFMECRMVKPFLPEQPDSSIREQETLIQYILGPKGHKAFQKLLEDASPYSDIPPNLD